MWQLSRRQDIKPLFGGNFAQLPICRYKGQVIAEKVQGDCELNTVHRLHVSLQYEVFRFDDVIGGEIQDRYAERADVLVKESALLQELFLGRDVIDYRLFRSSITRFERETPIPDRLSCMSFNVTSECPAFFRWR